MKAEIRTGPHIGLPSIAIDAGGNGIIYVFGDQPTRRDQLTAIRNALDAHLDAEADAMMEQRRGEMRA